MTTHAEGMPLSMGSMAKLGQVRYIAIQSAGAGRSGRVKIVGLCPINLAIKDPAGRATSKGAWGIPRSVYVETDFDLDGDLDDHVSIEDASDGMYEITVGAEPDALPTDTFTLIASVEGERVVLAENVAIAEIPSQPYQLPVDVNQRPVAACHDVVAEADHNCEAMVPPAQVDAGSFDPESDPIELSLDPAGPYPLGMTEVTLTVTDDGGLSGTCAATVTVEDATAPVVTCTVPTDVLWAPDHHLVPVGLMTTVSDNCDPAGAAESLIIEVWSDETEVPETGGGTGQHCPDAKDIETGLRVRKERRAREDGRVYLIIARAEDGCGNVGFGFATVVVPHDQSQAGLDLVAAQAAGAVATVEAESASAKTIAEVVAPLKSQGWTQHGLADPRGPHQ